MDLVKDYCKYYQYNLILVFLQIIFVLYKLFHENEKMMYQYFDISLSLFYFMCIYDRYGIQFCILILKFYILYYKPVEYRDCIQYILFHQYILYIMYILTFSQIIRIYKPIYNLNCVICLGKLDTFCYKIKHCPCKYYYHYECIQLWLENTSKCPTCRKLI
jgi:hypothetical protein